MFSVYDHLGINGLIIMSTEDKTVTKGPAGKRGDMIRLWSRDMATRDDSTASLELYMRPVRDIYGTSSCYDRA